MSDNGYIPLTPDTFSEGGGLLDDVDATIESARFVEFDFLGKADKPALCLQVAYKVDGDSAKARVEYYSAGALTRFNPSPDGKNLVKVGQATSLKRDSNAGIFLGRAVEADPELSKGLANPKVGVSCFDGRRVHLVRIPQPDRGGCVGKQGGTLLIITKFLAGAGKGKAADLDFDLDARQRSAPRAAMTAEEGTQDCTRSPRSIPLYSAACGSLWVPTMPGSA